MNIDRDLILRIGVALVLFWFGGSQLLNPAGWTEYLPEWLTGISPISPEVLVLVNGGVEVILGAFILLGMYVRISAFIVALHLFGIGISLGNTPSGIRDIGLGFMALALVFKKD